MKSDASFQEILEKKMGHSPLKEASLSPPPPDFFGPLDSRNWGERVHFLNPENLRKYSVRKTFSEPTAVPTEPPPPPAPSREERKVELSSLDNHELLALEQLIRWQEPGPSKINKERICLRDLKKSYRKLAKRFHPDREGGDSERFFSLHENYNCLVNALERLLETQDATVSDDI